MEFSSSVLCCTGMAMILLLLKLIQSLLSRAPLCWRYPYFFHLQSQEIFTYHLSLDSVSITNLVMSTSRAINARVGTRINEFLWGMNKFRVENGRILLSDSNNELPEQPSSGTRRAKPPITFKWNVWKELCDGIASGGWELDLMTQEIHHSPFVPCICTSGSERVRISSLPFAKWHCSLPFF